MFLDDPSSFQDCQRDRSSPFDICRSYGHLAVAVSGGGDSLALLLLADEWARQNNKKLTALTVDHGLREEAKIEASHVGDLCQSLSIDHHVLRWQAEKPGSGLQEAAREARYQLMGDFCEKRNIKALLTGHTEDDQAETVLMRLTRTKEGSRGLSGMAPEAILSLKPGQELHLLRPFLGICRESLRAFLKGRQVCWFDDPTNDDPRYERVRAREILKQKPDFKQKILHYCALVQRHRLVCARAAGQFIDEACAVNSHGVVTIDRQVFVRLPEPIKVLVVQSLLSVLGGASYLPSYAKTCALINRQGSGTLCRVLWEQKECEIFLHREMRDLPEAYDLSSRLDLWDGRIWVSADAKAAKVIRIASAGDVLDFDDLYPNHQRLAQTYRDRQALKTMPVVMLEPDVQGSTKVNWRLFEEVGGSVKASRALGAFDRFCPSFDFALRAALVNLFTLMRINGISGSISLEKGSLNEA